MAKAAGEQALIAPARGTRPGNRRQLIVAAAADLFYRKGYAVVSMAEVADAVAIGPSALYRHFRGKQELLATVVLAALENTDSALASASAADVQSRLAAAALEHRSVGVLWRRETRNLSPDQRAALRTVTQRIGARLAELVGERRPDLRPAAADLLARCALAVANSVSFHSLSLPEPGLTALLAELVGATIDAPVDLPDAAAHSPARTGLTATGSRRETILTEAAKLFARNGFTAVGIDDIGAAVGIAGPSLYNHFATKTDILLAAVFRGDAWLRMDMTRALARATDPADGLHRLFDSYRAFAFENPDLVQLLVTEAVHLPEDARHRARVAQHAYIAEWVDLVRSVHPDWNQATARIRVQAAQTMCNEIALTTRATPPPDLISPLATIGDRLLGISQPNR
ncbi:TetR/AcrR family transcriptional regulator [Nocardia sp. NPDC127526]|uniref:TetR/AcrR family transcriptional regulator n=1 Tax=Nocardia sp. NPDC127526 TaxID=3345393 RepID=UPI00362BEE35